MNYQTQFKRFETTANTWLNAVDKYSPAEFAQKPSDGEWSIGQVYHHIIYAHNNLIQKRLKDCINGTGKDTLQMKNFAGKLVFLMNALPPLRFKMPAKVAIEPLQPESKEWVKTSILEMIQSMKELAALLEKTKVIQKAKHPAFSYLTADEWYQFCEIHLRHHLRQKARIDKFLKSV